ncbi:GNAT family N-acetyltransferase [Kitasatospora sp. NPDC096147]|uniref:GNAT family N-acetyltransferase n=1 Tax=Kitasatospora sp. NPDC096147 TaxID=3364093 RepID=UPI003830506C
MTEGTAVRKAELRRADRPGDLGWMVMAHGELYAAQFDWNAEFEALVASIVAGYAAGHDPALETAWIAEVEGERAGCVMLVAGERPGVAKLRVLLVAPVARGLGLGTQLVQEAVDFARAAGYRKVSLWTTDSQASARRIYRGLGFALVRSESPEQRFGHEVVGQTWELALH